jgi:hypothetical protein
MRVVESTFVRAGGQDTPVFVYDDILPQPLFERALGAVQRTGTERLAPEYNTSIEGVSRITFWYDLADGPRNVVEEIICTLREVVVRGAECIGAEYWLGRTHAGVPIPIHTHINIVEEEAKGPEWVTILYLNEVPGLLEVLHSSGREYDGTLVDEGPALRVEPRPNRLVVCRAEVAHRVRAQEGWVPPAKGEPWNPPELNGRVEHRLTLPIDWWTYRPTTGDYTSIDYDGAIFPALRDRD